MDWRDPSKNELVFRPSVFLFIGLCLSPRVFGFADLYQLGYTLRIFELGGLGKCQIAAGMVAIAVPKSVSGDDYTHWIVCEDSLASFFKKKDQTREHQNDCELRHRREYAH